MCIFGIGIFLFSAIRNRLIGSTTLPPKKDAILGKHLDVTLSRYIARIAFFVGMEHASKISCVRFFPMDLCL